MLQPVAGTCASADFDRPSWDRNLAPPTRVRCSSAEASTSSRLGGRIPRSRRRTRWRASATAAIRRCSVTLSKPLPNAVAVLRELHPREEPGQRLDRARHGGAFGPSDPFNPRRRLRHQRAGRAASVQVVRSCHPAARRHAGVDVVGGIRTGVSGVQPDRYQWRRRHQRWPSIRIGRSSTGQAAAAVSVSSAGLVHVGLARREGNDAGDAARAAAHTRRVQPLEHRQYLRRSADAGDPRQPEFPGEQPDARSAARATRRPTRFLSAYSLRGLMTHRSVCDESTSYSRRQNDTPISAASRCEVDDRPPMKLCRGGADDSSVPDDRNDTFSDRSSDKYREPRDSPLHWILTT